MWSKWRFFNFFSKTAGWNLLKTLQNVELIDIKQPAKTACPNFAPFSSYSSIKLSFLVKTGQNGKNEVQRSSNNSRTKNAMKNLIRYSESAENSLSPMFHQILPSSMSSGSNFNLKMTKSEPKNMRFSRFFEISCQTTCHIPKRFCTMIAPKFPKTLQKTVVSYLS